ncbi:zinc finger protein 280C isoform X1 [Rhinichthys klamathensis goyatoka]|uniref:zinc finger protein 280C isoform X1 n=1 Tax=Rhinichthys klamathensis goyatoka TaxID=3034132 RepID=UPI0024B48783|nr:zinc finger protein 280C isoform X1 [Rhinichthys klamathensis goyatoka]
MSELFMECEEEELEPWQKAVPEINLIDLVDDEDDDDEPIFVGEICSSKPAASTRPGAVNQQNQRNVPVQNPSMVAASQKTPQTLPNPAMLATGHTLMVRGSAPSGGNPILIPLNTTLGPQTAPQPIIINNQGYIVASPQNLNSNTSFISSLGSQYPPGTTFTVVPAAGQQIVSQVSAAPKPGVIHRPQVQLIQDNVVTLSNVQAPANLSSQSHTTSISQNTPAITPILVKQKTLSLQPMNSRDNGTRINDTNNSVSKGAGENDFSARKKCPRCQNVFGFQHLKSHMKICCPELLDSVFPSTSKPDKQANSPKVIETDKGKMIMLVSDFYYGKCEGDSSLISKFKSNTTFKCNSCLKMLKNNIRFMNHMKHHLELEKQNSESWESHTTCQHCYRQYSTPFQLQCHIESAHSPFESTTNCKICELAFETEQVLLEHMRDNHKPGEMPYACQVCNYRSSFFSDVDNHFRTVHENTKDLLCPFCLKVLRSGHMYMQHYMRHQKKGIQRCGKCRLNFLTYKEKVEHKTHFHRTYRKPRNLEGLPPGTKVTIRASVSGAPMCSDVSSKSYIIPTSPEMAKQPVRPPANTTKPNLNGGRAKTTSQFSFNRTIHNNELKRLKLPRGGHKCVECLSEVMDPYVHYPLSLRCTICKFRSSCQKAFRQHMVRFHSISSKVRFGKERKAPRGLRSLTLVCLKCDFLADASGADQMTEHLLSRPNHSCQVIMEPVTNGGSEINRSLETHDDSKQLLPIKSDTEARDETEPIEISDVQAIPNEDNVTEDVSEVLGADKSDPDEVKDDKKGATLDVSEEESPKSLSPHSPSKAPVSPISALPGEGGITPTDFLCKTDGIDSVNTDSQLEPLTPSKVLEDDATENSQVEMDG